MIPTKQFHLHIAQEVQVNLRLDMSFPFPLEQDIRSVARRGAFFTAGAQVTKLLIHGASLILFARLFTPDDFGLIAMATPVLVIAGMLRDAGLGSAQAQRSSLTDEEATTLFLVNMTIGLTLAGLMFLGAPLVGQFYHDERVTNLVRASALVIVLGAASAQSMAILNRALANDVIALIECAAFAAGFLLALGGAFLTRSYWCLWLMPFGTALATTILSAWLSPWRPRWSWAPLQKVRDILAFGSHLTVSNLFDFAARNVDSILIGWFWGSHQLGLYDRAYKVVMFPLVFVNMPLGRFLLPLLARARDSQADYVSLYTVSVQAVLACLLPGICLLIFAPGEVVSTLLGAQWTGSAPVLAALGIVCAIQLFVNSLNILLLSQGRSKELMTVNGLSALCVALGFATSVGGGIEAVAWTYAIIEAVRIVPVILVVARTGPVTVPVIVATAGPFLAGVAAISLVNVIVPRTGSGLSDLVVRGVAYYVTLVLALSLFKSGRGFLRTCRSQLLAGRRY